MKPFSWHYVLAIIAAIVSFDFIRNTFTNDVAIFFGVANIADKFYAFPYGLDLAWEAKPIGNRIINYVLLNLAETVVPFSDAVNFAIVAKVISLAFLILIALYVAYFLKGEYTFWLIFFAFTTCCNFCIMQAEWWAVLLSLAVLAGLLHDNPNAHFISGGLLVFIGMVKGITALLFVPVLCSVYLLGKLEQERIERAISGIVTATITVCIAQLTIWPNMLPDLLLAPAITGSGRNDLVEMAMALTGQSIAAMFYIPVLLVGLAAVVMLILAGGFSNRKQTVVFILMWGSVAAMVFIHSEFFIYHFMLYALPAITTIIIGLRRIEAHG